MADLPTHATPRLPCAFLIGWLHMVFEVARKNFHFPVFRLQVRLSCRHPPLHLQALYALYQEVRPP